MATDRRVARVSEQIKREVSQMLVSGIKDDRVGSGMVSVTDVKVSGDLQHAKIFVSVYGDDEARETTMSGLKSATSFVRSQLGRRVQLRRTPEVIFIEDRSLERGTNMLSLINQLTTDRKASGVEDWLNEEAKAEAAAAIVDQDDDDFDDDEDED
jgi:ribosome-binding factor A